MAHKVGVAHRASTNEARELLSSSVHHGRAHREWRRAVGQREHHAGADPAARPQPEVRARVAAHLGLAYGPSAEALGQVQRPTGGALRASAGAAWNGGARLPATLSPLGLRFAPA